MSKILQCSHMRINAKLIMPILLAAAILLFVSGCAVNPAEGSGLQTDLDSPVQTENSSEASDEIEPANVDTTPEPEQNAQVPGSQSPYPSDAAVSDESDSATDSEDNVGTETPATASPTGTPKPAVSSPTAKPSKSPAPATSTPQASTDPGDAVSTPEPSQEEQNVLPPEEAITVKIVGPEDLLLFEIALDPAEIETAFDALKSACEAEGVALKYSGTGSFTYINKIGDYAERSQGPLSGWIYKVNGEAPTKSCSVFEVQKGDRVGFYFTLDLGKDVADKD